MIQEQVANKLMAYLKQMALSSAKGLSEVLSLLALSLKELGGDAFLTHKLNTGGIGKTKHMKLLKQRGEMLLSITVPADEIDNYKLLLKENKTFIMPIKNKNGSTYDITYREDDQYKVLATQEVMRAMQGLDYEITNMSFQTYYNNHATFKISNISPEEMVVLREKAVEVGLMYTLEEKDGEYTLHYGNEFKKEADAVFYSMGLDLTSDKKDKLLENAALIEQNRSLIRESLKGTKEETVYIISKHHQDRYIKLTKDDFTLYDNSKVVRSLNRDEKEFQGEFSDNLNKLDDYLVLSEEDYMKPEDEKWEIIQKKVKLYPDNFYETWNIENYTEEHEEKSLEYISKYKIEKIVPNTKEVSQLGQKIKEAGTIRDNIKKNNKEQHKDRSQQRNQSGRG